MSTERDWKGMFGEVNAYWEHDGNVRRPYARLTSGLISDGYFNAVRVAEDGHLFGLACKALWLKGHSIMYSAPLALSRVRVVGAAMGGVSLSTRIAEAGMCQSAYAEKVEDVLVFKRFEFSNRELFLLVEDTITTGGTLHKLRDALKTVCASDPVYVNVILALCNRSGNTRLDGVPIFSLVTPNFRTWEEGNNPFTADGKELVPPVHPKLNWHELTRDYA